MPRRMTPTLLVLLSTSACQNSSAPDPAWTTRDSARIEIVESRSAAWAASDAWFFPPSPEVILGSEAQAATRFYQVTGAVLTSAGGLVVANSGTGELRFFDPFGNFERAVGGQGDGPGEFRWIESVRAYRGDSILAYDDALARGTIFDSKGALGRTISFLLPKEGRPSDVLPLPDGRFVVQRSGPTAGREEEVEGLVINPATFSIWSSEGVPGNSFFSAPGDELFMLPSRDGTDYIRFQIPLFARRTTASLRDATLLTGFGGAFGIAAVSMDGRISQILRRPDPERILAPAEVDSTFAAMVGIPPGEGLTYNLPYPDTEPAFGRLLVDDDGFLWVAHYAQRGESPDMWSVFHPDGMYLGDLEVPANTELLDIASTMVVGRVKDELGLESIALWRLIKPGT